MGGEWVGGWVGGEWVGNEWFGRCVTVQTLTFMYRHGHMT